MNPAPSAGLRFSGVRARRRAGPRKLAVKLTRAGKRFLAAKKGHVKIGSTIAETVAKHTKVSARNLTLTIKRKKGKK
jgi:hypothetical protein